MVGSSQSNPGRFIRIALYLSLAALAVIILKIFFGHAGRSPYLAVDDSVANIALMVGEYGRLGFAASPVQGETFASRLDGFFNYGPWYFLVGGALEWMFGPSIVLMRAIHPVGMVAIAILGIVTLSRFSPAVAVMVGVAQLLSYHYGHWPMVRPDIMVAFLGISTIAAASTAILTGSRVAWMLAAMAAMGAITQHQICGAIAPALVLVWGLSLMLPLDPGGRRDVIGSFAACVVGVVVVLAAFAVLIDFRFADVLTHLSAYASGRAGTSSHGGYVAVMLKHFEIVQSLMPWSVRMIILPLAFLSAALLPLCFLLPGTERRQVVGLLLPPVALSTSYQLSLGLYGNWHSGYAILSQVTMTWAAGAFVCASILVLHNRRPMLARAAEAGLAALALVAVIYGTTSVIDRPAPMAANATDGPNIDEFVAQVLAPMPQRASAWGTVFFGLETGLRADLVQVAEGPYMVTRFKPEHRAEMAPDFLAFGYREIDDSAVAMMDEAVISTLFDEIPNLLPETRYHLVRLVDAPLYGQSRIYRRLAAGAAEVDLPPSVALGTAGEGQWRSRLVSKVPTTFRTGPVVTWSLPYTLRIKPNFKGRPIPSQVAELPQGDYLVAVQFDRTGQRAGTVVATETPDFLGKDSELGHGFVAAPYLPYEKVVHFIIRHRGGPIYLTNFDQDSRSMRVTDVWAIEDDAKPAPRTMPLPPLTSWKAATGGITVESRNNQLIVSGDNSQYGYQVMSAPIEVPRSTPVTFQLPWTSRFGTVGLGVLDQKGRWLQAPRTDARSVTVNTAKNTAVTLVLANNMTMPSDQPTKITIDAGAMSLPVIGARKTYADSLVACLPEFRMRNPEKCN